jgi:hypothetical protein
MAGGNNQAVVANVYVSLTIISTNCGGRGCCKYNARRGSHYCRGVTPPPNKSATFSKKKQPRSAPPRFSANDSGMLLYKQH